MRYSLLTQIALILISIVICVTVVSPMFTEIKSIQNEMFIYSDAVGKAQQFNVRLSDLIGIRNSFSPENMQRLERLLPTTIDTPKIMHDFESIFALKKIPIISISAPATATVIAPEVTYDENGEIIQNNQNTLVPQDFNLIFNGTYQDLKDILATVETNETLIEVSSLKFGEAQSMGSTQAAARTVLLVTAHRAWSSRSACHSGCVAKVE